jgi:hypothetical protein
VLLMRERSGDGNRDARQAGRADDFLKRPEAPAQAHDGRPRGDADSGGCPGAGGPGLIESLDGVADGRQAQPERAEGEQLPFDRGGDFGPGAQEAPDGAVAADDGGDPGRAGEREGGHAVPRLGFVEADERDQRQGEDEDVRPGGLALSDAPERFGGSVPRASEGRQPCCWATRATNCRGAPTNRDGGDERAELGPVQALSQRARRTSRRLREARHHADIDGVDNGKRQQRAFRK